MHLPPWVAEAYEMHRLVRLTGWTPDVIDAQPQVILRDLLAVDGVVQRLEAEQRAKAWEV